MNNEVVIVFENRKSAGELLTKKVSSVIRNHNTIVCALARGGVVVGKQVANKLKCPLIALSIKKIGHPLNPELALGAAAPNNVIHLDAHRIESESILSSNIKRSIEKAKRASNRRMRAYYSKEKGNIKSYIHSARIVLIVDDGIATGSTILTACAWINSVKPKKKRQIIIAVPVIAQETYHALQSKVDRIIAVNVAGTFYAVGQFYKSFPQVSDREVKALIDSNHELWPIYV